MKRNTKFRWDPLTIRLLENSLKNTINNNRKVSYNASKFNNNRILRTQKKRSQEEFQNFLHQLFNRNGPTIKYKEPDCWHLMPRE